MKITSYENVKRFHPDSDYVIIEQRNPQFPNAEDEGTHKATISALLSSFGLDEVFRVETNYDGSFGIDNKKNGQHMFDILAGKLRTHYDIEPGYRSENEPSLGNPSMPFASLYADKSYAYHIGKSLIEPRYLNNLEEALNQNVNNVSIDQNGNPLNTNGSFLFGATPSKLKDRLGYWSFAISITDVKEAVGSSVQMLFGSYGHSFAIRFKGPGTNDDVTEWFVHGNTPRIKYAISDLLPFSSLNWSTSGGGINRAIIPFEYAKIKQESSSFQPLSVIISNYDAIQSTDYMFPIIDMHNNKQIAICTNRKMTGQEKVQIITTYIP